MRILCETAGTVRCVAGIETEMVQKVAETEIVCSQAQQEPQRGLGNFLVGTIWGGVWVEG